MQLQPAERIWALTYDPLSNQVFEQLAEVEAVLVERCISLTQQQGRENYFTQPRLKARVHPAAQRARRTCC